MANSFASHIKPSEYSLEKIMSVIIDSGRIILHFRVIISKEVTRCNAHKWCFLSSVFRWTYNQQWYMCFFYIKTFILQVIHKLNCVNYFFPSFWVEWGLKFIWFCKYLYASFLKLTALTDCVLVIFHLYILNGLKAQIRGKKSMPWK